MIDSILCIQPIFPIRAQGWWDGDPLLPTLSEQRPYTRIMLYTKQPRYLSCECCIAALQHFCSRRCPERAESTASNISTNVWVGLEADPGRARTGIPDRALPFGSIHWMCRNDRYVSAAAFAGPGNASAGLAWTFGRAEPVSCAAVSVPSSHQSRFVLRARWQWKYLQLSLFWRQTGAGRLNWPHRCWL